MSQTVRYDDRLPRLFFLAALVWAVVGMLVGVLIAAMLFMPALNFAPFLTFGRLRPLHTNAVIFAFCGNMIFGGTYHSMQRLLKTRLFSDVLTKIHFYGWQFLIVFAALADAEPGTFYLTDFLLTHFDRLILRGLGIDRHPELMPLYFGNYTRLVYLAQREQAGMQDAGQRAAERLGLHYEYRVTGYGDLQTSLHRATEGVVTWQN